MNAFDEPWRVEPHSVAIPGGEPTHPSGGRVILAANGQRLMTVSDAQPTYVYDRLRAARIVWCVNALAGVSESDPRDHVQLALAVLRSPDDQAPLAALLDALLEKAGGPAAAGRGEDPCPPHGARYCERCHEPACEFCGERGGRVKNLLCCPQRVEAYWPREH